MSTTVPSSAVPGPDDPNADVPHYVYRLWDEAGDLLYVGCTKDLNQRMTGLASEKRWFKDIARSDAWRHPSRDAALVDERKRIETELPRYNVQCNPQWAPEDHWRFNERRIAFARGEIRKNSYMARDVLSGMEITDAVTGAPVDLPTKNAVSAQAGRTKCPDGHLLDDGNARVLPSGYKACRECDLRRPEEIRARAAKRASLIARIQDRQAAQRNAS